MLDRYDVIITGSGIAGMYTALNLPETTKILLVCKQDMMLCNTALAQGGVAAVLDTINDSYDLHFKDTMIAGGNENDPDAVRVLVTEGPDDVRKIYNWGVRFDKNPDGTLMSTLEGAHCRNRIVHHRDSTGQEIAERLRECVLRKKNIEVAENTVLFDINRSHGGLFASLITADSTPKIVAAPFIVLATGGIGQVYRYTTNSDIATGDGIRMAYELGCRIQNLHYVQFHPTAFAGVDTRQRFLISEAVRGEGAWLINCKGERFMHLYDERLELAPRDVVSRSILLESRRVADSHFALDISRKDADWLRDRFPLIYSRCMEYGIDLTKEPIPIYPCQHYLMGGIKVDLHSRTDVAGLYAVGECSCTGVHGHNRLASNSLLEALVFGRRAAQDITSRMPNAHFEYDKLPEIPDMSGAPLPEGLDFKINNIMQNSCFVIPDEAGIHDGIKQVDRILERLSTGFFAKTPQYYDVLSLATMAHIILKEMQKA